MKGRSPNFKSVFIFFSDARYKFYKSMSNGSLFMVIIPSLSYLPLLGMKGLRKINTNNFNGFRMC